METKTNEDILSTEIQWAFKIGSHTTVRVRSNVGYFNKFLDTSIDDDGLKKFFDKSSMCSWDDLKDFLADLFYHAMETLVMPSMRNFTDNEDCSALISNMNDLTLIQVDKLDGIIDDETTFEAEIDYDPDDTDETVCDNCLSDGVYNLKDDFDMDEYRAMPALMHLVTCILGEDGIE